MRIYLHDDKTGGTLFDMCSSLVSDILTPEQVEKRRSLPQGVHFFLDDVDALIMEITKPTQTVHFILAQAILAQKPTLCVYAKNQTPNELLGYIKHKTAPRPIKTFSYTEKTLLPALERFVLQHDAAARAQSEAPTIKFTLRVSARDEQYLEWKSDQRGVSKADLLRDWIHKSEADDQQYRQHRAQ